MRILVTGAAGYIGSVLCRALLDRGHEVEGWDLGWYLPPADVLPVSEAMRFRMLDVRDAEVADVASFDAVAHLAGLANDPLAEISPTLTHDINYAASVRLAEISKEAGVHRFVFSSSCSVYGKATADEVDETVEPMPLTAYAIDKLRTEVALTALADADFTVISPRNATVYGPSPRLRTDLVVNNLAAWGVMEGVLKVTSDGTPWRPLVHVADVADAFVALLEADDSKVRGQVVNIGSPSGNMRVRDVAEAVGRALPGTRVDIQGKPDPDQRSYKVRFDRLAELLPELNLSRTVEQGAKEVAAQVRELGLTPETLNSGPGQSVNRLRTLMDEGRLDPDLRWVTAATLG